MFFSFCVGIEVLAGFKATKALDMSPSWSSMFLSMYSLRVMPNCLMLSSIDGMSSGSSL